MWLCNAMTGVRFPGGDKSGGNFVSLGRKKMTDFVSFLLEIEAAKRRLPSLKGGHLPPMGNRRPLTPIKWIAKRIEHHGTL
jgi:hypothetical protein